MKLGGLDITDVKIGDTQVDKVYHGEDLVWQYVPPVPFEFTVKTDNAGVSTSTQFRMPLITSTGLNINVDWGDDSPIENITVHTNAIHTYAAAGTYTIKVLGSLLGWQFNKSGDRLKLLQINSWGILNISTNRGFYGCTNLTSIANDAPLITTTSLALYFEECTNFNGDLNQWNVSTVTDFSTVFRLCSSFNKPLNLWDTSNSITFDSTFAFSAFNQNIDSWNVSKCRSFRYMFAGNEVFNQPLNSWQLNTLESVSLLGMFSGVSNSDKTIFNQYIGDWDTSAVNNMSSMFAYSAFNENINTKIVNAGLLNEYTAWDTSAVTNMTRCFQNNTAFNQDIGGWDTSAVTTMFQMFEGASAFNQNIGAWNVSNVGVFDSMFYNATAFNNGTSTDINNWTIKTTGTVNMRRMFSGNNTTLSCKFNQPIGNWDTSAVNNMSSMFESNTAFDQDINTKIVNAGLLNEYTAWDTSAVTSMFQMFFSASAFNQNIGSWNVSSVTTFQSMFNRAGAFNNGGSDEIKNWQIRTASSVNMLGMFYSLGVTPSFNQPIGSWDTSAVNNMAAMFELNTAFDQDIGSWDISNVDNFSSFMAGKSAANYSPQNLASIYNNWSQLTLKPNLTIDFNTIDYCDTAEANKQSIATNFGWNIIDGNAVPC